MRRLGEVRIELGNFGKPTVEATIQHNGSVEKIDGEEALRIMAEHAVGRRETLIIGSDPSSGGKLAAPVKRNNKGRGRGL